MINGNLNLKVNDANDTLTRLSELKTLLDTGSTELNIRRKRLEKLLKDFEHLRDNGIEDRLTTIQERLSAVRKELSIEMCHKGSMKSLGTEKHNQRTETERPIADFVSKFARYQRRPKLEEMEYDICSNDSIPDNIRSSLLRVLHCLSSLINGNDSMNSRTSDERTVNVLSHFGMLVEIIKSEGKSETDSMSRNVYKGTRYSFTNER